MDTEATNEERARREHAFTVLESIERLIWTAEERNESIPQTRLYYEKVLAGYNPDTPAPLLSDASYGDVLPDLARLKPSQSTSSRRTAGRGTARASQIHSRSQRNIQGSLVGGPEREDTSGQPGTLYAAEAEDEGTETSARDAGEGSSRDAMMMDVSGGVSESSGTPKKGKRRGGNGEHSRAEKKKERRRGGK